MSVRMDCAEVRERLPDFAAGRLDEGAVRSVEAHLTGCDTCPEELSLVRLLQGAPSSVPAGLADRLVQAVDHAAAVQAGRGGDRARPGRSLPSPAVVVRRPWWALSAAAVAALAIGIGVNSQRGTSAVEGGALASEFEAGELWVSDDGMLAGAPALEALTDEELLAFLDELSSEGGGSGGTA